METHNSLDRKKAFQQETDSLLRSIEKSIEELSTFSRIYHKGKDQNLIDKMNRLKYHRRKLEECLEQIQSADQPAWLKIRDSAQATFQQAKQEFLHSSEAIEKK
jgi:transposase-like protein